MTLIAEDALLLLLDDKEIAAGQWPAQAVKDAIAAAASSGG